MVYLFRIELKLEKLLSSEGKKMEDSESYLPKSYLLYYHIPVTTKRDVYCKYPTYGRRLRKVPTSWKVATCLRSTISSTQAKWAGSQP